MNLVCLYTIRLINSIQQ